MSDANKKMTYVRLGNSGLKVSKIILGTVPYGSTEWNPWALGEEECAQHVKYAYDAGIQTFDTADTYSNGISEILLGKAIKRWNLPRDEIVVMTKVCGVVAKNPGEKLSIGLENPDNLGYVNQRGLSRKHIFQAVKHSLERLQLDYVDVLQCHRFDNETPIAETMHALHDVVQAGYVRYIGMSSCWAWQFHIMQNYAIQNNLTPFIAMQNHYNLLYREEEREMIPTIKHFGVGCIPYSSLAMGVLARPLGGEKTKRGSTDPYAERYSAAEGTPEVLKRVEEIALKKGISMAQVSLAWVMHKDGITAPIVGATSIEKLQDLIGSINASLSAEEIKYLDELYKPQAILGHS